MVDTNGHLLIVEPDESHVELIRIGLQGSPWSDRVEVAGDVGQAREHLSRCAPALILSRFDLPDGRGIDLTEPVNGMPACGVVVMDEIVEESRAVEAIKGGALDYVVKSHDFFTSLPRILERAEREWANVVRRRQAEQREAHLKQVLLAIRNVNQLITRETDRDRLIQQACENLIETRGYFTSWIVLFDQAGAVQGSAVAGDVVHFDELVQRLESGERVHCVQETAQRSGVHVYEETRDICGQCPLAAGRTDRSALSMVLEFEGKRYGLLTVSLPAELAEDPEEQGLFEEVVGDIGFALSKIEDAEALRDSQEFVRSTIDSLSAHVCVLDASGVIIAVNQAWRDFASANPPLRGNVNEGVDYLAVCDETTGQDAEIARAFAEGIRVVSRGEREHFQLEYPCHSPSEERWFVGRVTRFAGGGDGRVVISHENITERKRAEESLKFRSMLLDQIGDSVTATDLNGVIRYVNAANARLLGKSPDEMIGQSVHAYGEVPERGATQQEIIDTTLAEGSFQGEVVNITRDGAERTMFVRTWVLHDDKGQPTGLCGIATDITERKRAEEALREGEEKYRSILEHIEEGYYEVDLAGNFTFFNDSTCRILGYDHDELMGMNNRQYMDEPNARVVYQTFNQVYRTGVPSQSFDWELIRKDGSICSVEASVSLIRDAQDQPMGFRGIFRDITDRKRVEEALRESEGLLSRSQEVARLGSWQLDLTENRLVWSDQVYRIFGMEPDAFEATYEAFLDAVHPEDRDAVDAAYRESLAHGGDSYEIEHRVVRKDTGAVRWVHERCEHVWNASGRVIRSIGMVQDITERREAEQALRQSEERHRQIVETANEGIWVIDDDAKTTFVNRRMADMLGYEPEEMIGTRLHDHALEQWEQIADRELERRQRGDAGKHDFEFRRKDGSSLWAIVSANPIFDDQGRYAGALGMVTDITDRRAAEQALRDSEERYRTVAENFPNGALFLIDRDIRYIFADGKALAEAGLSKEDLIGKTVFEAFPPEVSDVAGSECRRIFDGEHVHYEVTYQGRIYDNWGMPIVEDDGAIRRGIVITIDVTERKLAEQDLAEKTRHLESVTENSPDVLFRFDRGLRFVFINGRSEAISGLSVEEHLGKTCHELGFPSSLCDVVDTTASSVFETGEPREVEFAFPSSPDGPRVLQARVVPEFGDHGVVESVLGIVRDVTQQRQTEEQHRRLESKMQHAQKLESLGVLAGGIAHDFNNLLVGILGNASLALMDLPTHAPARESIQQIEDAAQRAADLTNQMLAYSGRGRFVVQPLNVNELVGEMAHLLESVISKKAALRFDLTDNLPPIEGDATQLRQVIMNLITNAAEAIGEKSGIVLVRTTVADVDRGYIARATYDDGLCEGRYVALEVSDTGCGMDEATRAKMFDPFFTSKFSGRGLGLAAVLGIVRGHKGAINVYSELGSGTTIKVLLPVCEHEVSPVEKPTNNGGQWHAEGTVLVVDDERSVLEVAKRTLERAGFQVLTAETGREGVRLFREYAYEIRAVLLDMTMPDMNGEETFRELRRIRSDVPVILSSGYNEQEVTSRFAGKGLAGFIQKPYQAGALLSRMRDVLS